MTSEKFVSLPGAGLKAVISVCSKLRLSVVRGGLRVKSPAMELAALAPVSYTGRAHGFTEEALMTRSPSHIFRSGASLLLGALLLVPTLQQKGCDQNAPKAPPTPAGEFDAAKAERDVRRQVEDLRLAFESKQTTGVMRALDPTGLSAYSAFEDQVTNLVNSTTELRMFFRSASVQVHAATAGKPAMAQAMVDAEMVYSLKASPTQQKRKSDRLQMDFELGESGWRFTKLEPRSFFTP